MKRRLALRSEYLAPLSADELLSVAGGVSILTGVYPTVDRECPTVQACIAPLPSLHRACPTEYCTGTTSF